ncbi:MAG TPA: polysaccharide pyruvyl transferase family protein [Candidatus Saccharimonadales bacterium]|nr:polysaccharide pyruvyl transferase family protein [Candidatus Saccharimonadales bacterium]
MTKPADNKPILLLGAYGRGNAGDDVFLHAALELFKDKKIYINAAYDDLLPDVAKGNVHTLSTMGHKDILAKLKLYFRIKEVVYWGGDLWVELYGAKRPKQLLYKMIVLNVVFRLSGKKIWYVGCGIGKLHGYPLFLARLSARLARKIVVRESRSAKVLGLKNIEVLPDIAINLPFNKSVHHALPKKRPFTIVVSVLHSIPNKPKNFPKLISSIAKLINSLPEDKFKVIVLPMHVTEAEENDDLWASEQMMKLVKHKNTVLSHERELKNIVAMLCESDLVIGSRLHTNILAAINGTPCIGIAYRPKVRSFFVDNNLGDYCVDITEVEKVPEIFQRLYKDYNNIGDAFYEASRQMLSKRAAYKALVKEI